MLLIDWTQQKARDIMGLKMYAGWPSWPQKSVEKGAAMEDVCTAGAQFMWVFCGCYSTHVDVAFFHTNKDSLGLKTNWLSIDLTEMWLWMWLDRSLWDFNIFKVTRKIFFNNKIRETLIYYVKIMLAQGPEGKRWDKKQVRGLWWELGKFSLF